MLIDQIEKSFPGILLNNSVTEKYTIAKKRVWPSRNEIFFDILEPLLLCS